MSAEQLSQTILSASFSIWVIYGVLQGVGHWPAAVGFGLLASISLLAAVASLNIKIKLLDWVLLAYFVIAAIATFLIRSTTFPLYSSVVIWSLYSAVTWTSIAVRRPFSLQYAYETAPPEVWHTAEFLRANEIISSVWGAAFVANIVLVVIALNMRHSPLLIGVLAPLLTMGTCTIFTSKYTKVAREAAHRAATD